MVLKDQEEKKEAIWDFYNNLLGTIGQREFTLDLEAFHRPAIDLLDLEQVFTEEEVWSTIKALPSDKAPRSDGHTGRFYKVAWEVIKPDFMAAISRLMQGGGGCQQTFPPQLNLCHIATQDGRCSGGQGFWTNQPSTQLCQNCHETLSKQTSVEAT
jgi:hypothetical protein